MTTARTCGCGYSPASSTRPRPTSTLSACGGWSGAPAAPTSAGGTGVGPPRRCNGGGMIAATALLVAAVLHGAVGAAGGRLGGHAQALIVQAEQLRGAVA